MKCLRPNQRGVLVASTPHPPPNITARPYDQPSSVLPRLDRIRTGATPRLALIRCLHENTFILMADMQLKKISEVKVGDFVISGRGIPAKVLNVFERGEATKLVSFRTDRMIHPVICTADHKILVFDIRDKDKYSTSYYLNKKDSKERIKWIQADELTNKTFPLTLESPEFFYQKDQDIDLSNFVSGSSRSCKISETHILTVGTRPLITMRNIAKNCNATYWQVAEVSRERIKFTKPIHYIIKEELEKYQKDFYKKIKRYLPVTYNLGLLFGVHIGDGYARERKNKGGNITISCNGAYPDRIKLFQETIRNLFGAECVVTKDRKDSNCYTITFYSVIAARLLKDFGKSQNKHLPSKYLFKNKEYLQGILDGIQLTDGSHGAHVVTNTSPHVINLTYHLLEYLQKNPKISLENPRKGNLYKGRVIQSKNINWHVYFYNSHVSKNEERNKIGIFRISSIRSIKKIDGQSARVYDLEIEGEEPSFMAENTIVHNSQGGIGDVLMTLPTVKAIAKKYQTQVVYGTDFEYLEGALPKVLLGNPYIEKVVPWKQINYEDFDAVVDLTCPCVFHEKPKADPINRIDLFARHACVILEDRSIDYYFQPGETAAAKEFLESNNVGKKRVILLHPFSSTTRRDLAPALLQQVLIRILSAARDCIVIMVTHDTDHTRLDWKYSDVIEVRDWNIRKIAALMHHSSLVMCPDSSILHMAGALKKKTVSWWGPTDPRARINYYTNSIGIAPGLNLSCFPCWYTPCRVGETCWKRMGVDLIANTCLAVLNNQTVPLHLDVISFNNPVEGGELSFERV